MSLSLVIFEFLNFHSSIILKVMILIIDFSHIFLNHLFVSNREFKSYFFTNNWEQIEDLIRCIYFDFDMKLFAQKSQMTRYCYYKKFKFIVGIYNHPTAGRELSHTVCMVVDRFSKTVITMYPCNDFY